MTGRLTHIPLIHTMAFGYWETASVMHGMAKFIRVKELKEMIQSGSA